MGSVTVMHCCDKKRIWWIYFGGLVVNMKYENEKKLNLRIAINLEQIQMINLLYYSNRCSFFNCHSIFIS